MSVKSKKPLKDQLAELDNIIDWFNQDSFDLDEALNKFDQGAELAKEIKQRLEVLDNKITVLKQRFDNKQDLPKI